MAKIFLIFLTLFVINSFAQKNDNELLNADKKFAALSYHKGVGVAFDEFLADDAVFLSTTQLPIEGKIDFMKLFDNTKSTVIWQPTGSFKESSGTSGYTYGLSKWIYPLADSISFSYYVYHTSWLKDKSAKWKVTTDIGTEITLDKFSIVSKDRFKYTKTAKPLIEKVLKESKCKIVYFSFESDRKGSVALKPLIEKYRNQKHPLNYHSLYELIIMVVLSAQTTDDLINEIAPPFFKNYPNFKSLSSAKHEDLIPYLSRVRNFFKKTSWILPIAQQIKDDKNIPKTIESLVELKGMGRKSANVIMREAKIEAEGTAKRNLGRRWNGSIISRSRYLQTN